MTDYEWLTELGLCHKCRKERAAPGKKFCYDCLSAIREDSAKRYDPEKAKKYQCRRREIYREKKKAGICVRCSNPATHGIYCYECSIKAKRRSHKRAKIRKLERHERGLIPDKRKEAGLCKWCGKKAIEGLQCCEEHQKIFSEAGEKGYESNLRNGNNQWINEVEAWKKKNNWSHSESI